MLVTQESEAKSAREDRRADGGARGHNTACVVWPKYRLRGVAVIPSSRVFVGRGRHRN